MHSVLDDLRFSFRELRKRSGLALTAIISLALGIGATTAVFSVIYGLLANPYPYQGADRMIHLTVVNERGDRRWIGITGPQLKLLRQVHCIESAAATWGTWNLTTTGEESAAGRAVDADDRQRREPLRRCCTAGPYTASLRRAGWAGPATGNRPQLSVLAAALQFRSGSDRPHAAARTQKLHDRRRAAIALHMG